MHLELQNNGNNMRLMIERSRGLYLEYFLPFVFFLFFVETWAASRFDHWAWTRIIPANLLALGFVWGSTAGGALMLYLLIGIVWWYFLGSISKLGDFKQVEGKRIGSRFGSAVGAIFSGFWGVAGLLWSGESMTEEMREVGHLSAAAVASYVLATLLFVGALASGVLASRAVFGRRKIGNDQ